MGTICTSKWRRCEFDLSRNRRLALGIVLFGIVSHSQAQDRIVIGSSRSVGSDVTARMFHSASRLTDGRVVVTGGIGLHYFPPSLYSIDDISVFDPESNRFDRPIGQDGKPLRLHLARSSHTQTTLLDGRVLIVGGMKDVAGRFLGRETDTAEILDLERGTVESLPLMSELRSYHSATLLDDGRVVIAGGGTWQFFDPSTNSWLPPRRISRRRNRHGAVLIDSQRLILIGGLGGGGDSIESIDLESGESTLFHSRLRFQVNDLSASLMPDGRIFIVGGQKNYVLETVTNTYIFDPSRDELIEIDPPPNRERGISDYAMIRQGAFIHIFGGEEEKGRHDKELNYYATFDTNELRWCHWGRLTRPRDDLVAVELIDGDVLIVGGASSAFDKEMPTAAAERFTTQGTMVGDLSLDGGIDERDVMYLRSALGAIEPLTEKAKAIADVDRNGRVDNDDVAALQRLIRVKSADRR